MTTTQARWWGPIGLEGQRTGDGRTIKSNSLTWGELPLPLRWAPEDFGAHDGAVVVGRILGLSRDSQGRIIAHGDFDLESERGREAYRQVHGRLTPGISMDLDNTLIEDDGVDILITEARVRGATLVAIPAFDGARISSTDVTTLRASATEETFNWVEEAGGLPKYIKRIAKHLQKKGMTEGHAIAVAVNAVKKMCATGDVNFPGAQQVNAASRAEACAALAEWEAKKAKARATAAHNVAVLRDYSTETREKQAKAGEAMPDGSYPIANCADLANAIQAIGRAKDPAAVKAHIKKRAAALDCPDISVPEKWSTAVLIAAGTPFPAKFFEDPRLPGPTPLTVTDDGHVFGHIALWGSCHIGNPEGANVCTQPPSSPTNYSFFNTHEVVTTSGRVAVGRLTTNTLHAGARLAANDTVHHYEHTGAVGAYVRAGEDAFGIWITGAAHPEADVDSLRAAPVSGDWRRIGKGLELVGILAVNIPGFPVPRPQALVASGDVVSLVAAGLGTVETQIARFQVAKMASRLAREARSSYNGTMKFGYETQWRVPRGNPKGGQWIDMPDLAFNDFEVFLQGLMDSPEVSLSDDKMRDIGENMEKAAEWSRNAADSLRIADGEGAKMAAVEADIALSAVEAQLQDAVDMGEIPEIAAGDLGESLDKVRESIATVKDADLSLLDEADIGSGEGDIGAADATADVDAADVTDIGTAETDIGVTPAPVEDAFTALKAIDPTDHAAQKQALDDLPAGSVIRLSDREFTDNLRKNEDGTWTVLNSTLADNEDPELGLLTTGMLLDNYEDDSPVDIEEGDPDAQPLWSELWEDEDAVPVESEKTDMVPGEGDFFKKQAAGTIDFPGVNPDGTIIPSDNEDDWPEATVVNDLPVGAVIADDAGYEFTKTGLGTWEVSKPGPTAEDDELPLGAEISSSDILAGGDAELTVRSVDGETFGPPVAPKEPATGAPGQVGILEYHGGGAITVGDRVSSRGFPNKGIPDRDGEVIGPGDNAGQVRVRFDDGTEESVAWGGLDQLDDGVGMSADELADLDEITIDYGDGDPVPLKRGADGAWTDPDGEIYTDEDVLYGVEQEGGTILAGETPESAAPASSGSFPVKESAQVEVNIFPDMDPWEVLVSGEDRFERQRNGEWKDQDGNILSKSEVLNKVRGQTVTGENLDRPWTPVEVPAKGQKRDPNIVWWEPDPVKNAVVEGRWLAAQYDKDYGSSPAAIKAAKALERELEKLPFEDGDKNPATLDRLLDKMQEALDAEDLPPGLRLNQQQQLDKVRANLAAYREFKASLS